jgi:hypothetical protein
MRRGYESWWRRLGNPHEGEAEGGEEDGHALLERDVGPRLDCVGEGRRFPLVAIMLVPLQPGAGLAVP